MARMLRFLILAFLLIMSQGLGAAHVSATSDRTTAPTETVRDSDSDGDPDLVILRRDFTGDGHRDKILISDTHDRLKRLDDWQQAAEYDGVRFIYDAGSDGTAEVIISFQRTEKKWGYVARVFDSHISTLPYEVRENSISIPGLADSQPAVIVRSKQPWLTKGEVSYNLELVCKPSVRCMFDGETYNRTKNVSIDVVDRDRDGMPEYEVRQVNPRFSPGAALFRTQIMVSKRSELTLDPGDGILWPYLGTGRAYTRRYGQINPPIQVDWETGEITTISEFVASRGEEDNYFIYSFNKLDSEGVNPPSFEYPFNFYDLARDDDGVPELQIRMVSFSKGSYFGLGLYPQTLPFSITQSRYSWDQNNDGQWDYKIGLLGTGTYSNVTKVGTYRLRMPKYGRMPEWVLTRRWQTATFVHVPRGFQSSEGIYYGGFASEKRRAIFDIEADSGQVFGTPPSGYRFEASRRYRSQVKIYYSPIDQGLHLYGLDYGRWNQSQDSPTLYYRNSDSDPYVDIWERGNTTLIAETGILISNSKNKLYFKYTNITHAEFVIQPPGTHSEWKTLRNRLSDRPNATADLDNIFKKQKGNVVEVTGADLTEYVPTNTGFRVFANLSDDSRVIGFKSLTLPDNRNIVFIFTETGQLVGVNRATPPKLSIENVSPGEEGRAVSLERNEVVVSIRNEGWQTAENVSVVLVDGRTTIANATIDVTGKRTETMSFGWWPQSSRGNLEVVVRRKGKSVASDRMTVQIAHRDVPSIVDRYQISNRGIYLSLGTAFATVVGIILTARRVIQ